MKKLLMKLVVLMLLTVLTPVGTGIQLTKASAQTIYVDDDNAFGPWDGTQEHPYWNITSAITHASTGDAIFVFNGTYREHLTIDKSVSLSGQDVHGTIIHGNQRENVISIVADKVNISKFTIQGSDQTSELSDISINSHGNNISHNIIRDNYYGIYMFSSTNSTLSNNSVYNNTNGISLSGSNTDIITHNNISQNKNIGIRISDTSNITLRTNNVSMNEIGIAIIASGNNTLIDNNIFLNSIYGVYIFGSKKNDLSENKILSNDVGIWISQSTENMLTNNEVSLNERFGIYLNSSIANTIQRNEILANSQFGIRLDYSSNNTVMGNTLSNNLVRPALLYFSNDNTILHNNFINHPETIADINSTNHFHSNMEGNYWSDYKGIDNNQDGIGDLPYIIDANNQDKYPLMGVFTDFPVTYENLIAHVITICNSTITQFEFDETVKMLDLNVTGANNTTGFCRITVPQLLVAKPCIVLVDNSPTNATVLPTSNSTHTLLHFTYNQTELKIQILSKPSYELLQKYDSLYENYQNLNRTHYQLLFDCNLLNQTYQQLLLDYLEFQTEYKSLNQTYQQLLENWTKLLADYDALSLEYQETLANYTTLQDEYNLLWNEHDSLSQACQQALTNYTTLNQTYLQTMNNYTRLTLEHNILNQTYQELMANYTRLQSDYASIRPSFDALLAQYDSLNSQYADTRLALLCVSAAAIAVTATTASLTIKYHRKSKKQEKLAEKYKSELERVSILDVARSKFEADINRRREKIQSFERKYGVTIRPRATLEDVIKSLEIKKKKEE